MTPEQIKKTKAFQDWMDKNHPNWVGCTDSECTNGTNLNKGSGYGSFGTSTNKAWGLYGDEFNEFYKNIQTSSTTETTVDPKIKELQNYLSVIRFFSPNGARINLKLTDELYNDFLPYFEGLKKDSEPNITLLQALISFLIESERYNISSFDAPQGYQSQIELLIQEK